MLESVVLLAAGRMAASGREVVVSQLCENLFGAIDTLTIRHAIAHGKVGAVDASAVSGGQVRGICLVLEFADARAERVNSVSFYGDGFRRP
ncbi:MAG: hypothetical protein KGM42_09390 [Hyphomicrobiales bacterium]|nr:hypothetical protein [Hyphomicrobiales bacterium]